MQNNHAKDRLVVLSNKLNALSGLSPSFSGHSIFRVHTQLREVNKKVYEPVLVSIGPYHRGNEKYQMMEEFKLRYLGQAIQWIHVHPLEYYLSKMRSLVEESRKCYAEHVELDDDEFAEMLLLDSCFVVEVIREIWEGFRQLDWMVTALQRDLMLFENQLPFFVIHDMFHLIVDASNDQNRFTDWAYNFISDLYYDIGLQRIIYIGPE